LPLTFFSEDSDEKKASQSDYGVYLQPHFDFEKSRGIILYNNDIEHFIFNIINSTEKYFFLVTPFIDDLRYFKTFERSINEAYNKGNKIFFILKKPNNEAKDGNAKKDMEKIEEIERTLNDKIELFLVDSLHAKIFLNEKQVLITSMNLTYSGSRSNHEIGCLLNDSAISNWIVDNIILKKMLNDKKVKHTRGKCADWVDKIINEGKITTDDTDNNISSVSSLPEKETVDLNKNYNVENNNVSSCNPNINNNNSDVKLLTTDVLYIDLLKLHNINVNENYSNTILFRQFSEQMKNHYKFERKDYWKSDKDLLQRYVKITKDMYEWAIENIKLQS